MASIDALEIYIGEDVTLRLTVLDEDEERYDLEQFTDIEFELKPRDGSPNPAQVLKNLDDGVTLLDQSEEDTKGQCDIVLEAADTAALTSGTMRYDVWGIHPSEGRKLIIAPSDVVIRSAVNLYEAP